MTQRIERFWFLGIAMMIIALQGASRAANDPAVAWLMRMQDAAETVSYQGTFVYAHQGQIEATLVARRVENGTIREHLLALNGPPREVIRDDRQVWCYLPDERIGVHEYRQVTGKDFPSVLPADLADLRHTYSISFGSERTKRIADRDAREIVVRPVDDLRYGYDLWIDVETGLLLRTVLTQPDGEPVEQYMFTHLDLKSAVSDEALEPFNTRESLEWYGIDTGRDEVRTPKLSWELSTLPSGFELVYQNRRRAPMTGLPVEQLVLSDGLAAVSVFVQGVEDNNGAILEGVSRMGAVHAFGRRSGNFQITVIGEVPAQTVSLIGRAVRRR